MRKVTSDFKNQVERDNRNYYEWVDITLKDGTVLNLTNENIWNGGIKIEDAVSDTSEFQIGTAIINKATVTLSNLYDDFTDYDFNEAKIVIYIGYNIASTTVEESWRDINGEQILDINGNEILLLHNGTFLEKVKMFTGTVVDSPYQNSSLITLTCEDNMLLFDRDYSESKLIYPATRAQILRDACEMCGVSLETLTFDNSDYIVNTRPSDEKLTFRQVIAWTAQLGGQFLRCNSDGRLCCGWYDLKNYEADTVNEEYFDVIDSNSSVTVNSEDVIITGIQVTAYQENQSEEEAADTSLYGKTGYIIAIADNKLIEKGTAGTVAAMIGKRVAGMRFRPLSASTLNNPTYEAGDICIIKDRKGVSYKSFLTSSTFQVGKYHTVQCGAKSAAKNSSKQYSLFSQVQAENRKNFQREKTERERVAEEFNTALNSSSGMYPTEVTQEDGSTILYVHDKKTLKDSKNVFKITSYGVGFSTDGGKTYQFGFTIDGDFLTRILYAVGINADYIKTGALTVSDSKGSIIFQADIANKRVIISGDYVQIGGKTVPEKLNEVLSESKTYSDGKLSEYSKEAAKELESLREYAKEKSGTWRQETDPALSWTKTASIPWNDVDGNSILDVNENEIILVFEEDKVNHEGDLWKNTKTNRDYRYENGAWVEMPVPDFVFDEIDGKSSLYYTQPVPPYSERDCWFTGKEILVCVNSRETGDYNISDWAKKDGYTDDTKANEVAESLKTVEKDLKTQIDGKIDTFSQTNDPSVDWDTAEKKAAHTGDIWYDESEKLTKRWSGTAWSVLHDKEAEDAKKLAETKRRIFATTPVPPYDVNDLWSQGSDGDMMICKVAKASGEQYAETDWGKATKYTDDSAVDKLNKTLNFEEIFKRLTNDGVVKGIYKEGNQLYISFTYAKGGKLTLGGKDNLLGMLELQDSLGKICVKLDKSGLVFGRSQGYGKDYDFEGGTSIGTSGLMANAPQFYGGITLSANKDAFLNNERYKVIYVVKGYDKNYLTLGDKMDEVDILARTISLKAYNIYGSESNSINPAIELDGDVVVGDPDITGSVKVSITKKDGKVKAGEINTNKITGTSIKVNATSFTVTGTKNRIVDTQDYSNRLLYCYETASPMFGDIGEGETDESGKCIVILDDLFRETITESANYQVFLQKCGKGDLWVSERTDSYFAVEGTKNLKFSWEVKARQRDYESTRLEMDDDEMVDWKEIDYEQEGCNVLSEYIANIENGGA